jgi:hypothetical protein
MTLCASCTHSILMLRLRGAETLADMLLPLRMRLLSLAVQLEYLLRSQSLRFLLLPYFFTNHSAKASEGIKGDARAENMLSNYISSSQFVTIRICQMESW